MQENTFPLLSAVKNQVSLALVRVPPWRGQWAQGQLTKGLK